MGEVRSVEEKLEFKRKLESRTSDFAVSVFQCLDNLPFLVSSKVIALQVGKSASSIGANYREANRAESVDDFTHKIGIVLKESSETLYWLDLLQKLYPANSAFQKLTKECGELLRLFQTIKRKMTEKRNNRIIECSNNRMGK